MEKSKTREELAKEYGVSRRTFYSWLKQADLNFSRGVLNPRDLKEIYTRFGRPKELIGNK